MNKKIISMAVALLVIAGAIMLLLNSKEKTASLEKLYVVNTGSLTGTFNAIQNAYTSDLQEHFEVELVQTGNTTTSWQVPTVISASTISLVQIDLTNLVMQ